MLRVVCIGSGSKGNCIFIQSDNTKLLVDLGLSIRRIKQGLGAIGVDIEQLDGVVLTHSHSDHIKHAPAFLAKYDVPLFAPNEAIAAINRNSEQSVKAVRITGCDFFLNDLTISPFKVSHDAECFGYSFYSVDQKVSIATDLGKIDERIISRLDESDLVFIEANHDESTLNRNRNYPYYLKRRILSDLGHLSNAATASACGALANKGIRRFVLGHLSEQNNSPKMALDAVNSELSALGLKKGADYEIEAASQSDLLIC